MTNMMKRAFLKALALFAFPPPIVFAPKESQAKKVDINGPSPPYMMLCVFCKKPAVLMTENPPFGADCDSRILRTLSGEKVSSADGVVPCGTCGRAVPPWRDGIRNRDGTAITKEMDRIWQPS